MRAFVAIELPEDVTFALSQLSLSLPVGRVMAEENLHLTLVFLGDQSEAQLQELHHELAAIPAPQFELGFDGLGCFGAAAPKILYARIAESQALSDLHQQLRRAAHRVGIVLARQRYNPHVTLARFGRGLSWRETERLEGFIATHSQVDLPGFSVAGFSLFQSKLHRDGAIHEQMASYGFKFQ
ncbi:RNA 2',3'-cyclic phosphodiesterase [Parasedimentitalea psychrophila]|uniref:RNA 2',3'-cyclic phosphodiesterase n=1 Tax=Parasedimentitalea psychrophila TaxID=2997337 RepID=A0A9Y2L0C5_9RHOB|nr:RNA 2',3'-cyclic phosphodiesterase [Parasedimentitalea psychrophila]WIY26366.1 RNA 2',3'-cyclic phosphodiesterase [Parasedimentitalea psychrophila]